MQCVVRYQSPDHEDHEHTVKKSILIGRSPGGKGLRLTPEDSAVSSVALELTVESSFVRVKNRSSYAQIDVHHDQGVRFLFPGEALETTSSIRVVIPGSVYKHEIHVSVAGLKAEAAPTGTRPLIDFQFGIAEERLPTVVMLCAARFFPDRFGHALMSANDIARTLSGRGYEVTPKAVNNKIQRTKEDIAEKLEIYLDRREDLADWLIRNGHVSRAQVEDLMGW
jgi:hypothetical protein